MWKLELAMKLSLIFSAIPIAFAGVRFHPYWQKAYAKAEAELRQGIKSRKQVWHETRVRFLTSIREEIRGLVALFVGAPLCLIPLVSLILR